MHTENRIAIAAPPETVYALAAAIEDWPRILPHYRWVTILEDRGTERLVEMAARRDWIPVWWRSIQRCDPIRHRIEFIHVRGKTRGMVVEWRIESDGHGGSDVSIGHEFRPRWPLVPDLLVRLVIGRFFVGSIAQTTLRRIKALAEASASTRRTR